VDTDEDKILCTLDEAEVTECAYLVIRHTRLMFEGESVEAPVRREFGLLNAVQEAVLLTVAVLFFGPSHRFSQHGWQHRRLGRACGP